MSNGCISAPCSSSASCRARSWAWAHMLPCTSTVAPKVASRSRMNSGVVSGTQTVTGIPICRPAYATASPAFPPELDTSSLAPRALARAQARLIPRSLKLPEGCRASIFSHTRRPSARLSGADSTSGVRRYPTAGAALAPRAGAAMRGPRWGGGTGDGGGRG